MNIITGFAEFIGTFIFISIILHTSNMKQYQPIAIGIGLVAALFIVSSISGGHLNPAITIMKLFGEQTIDKTQAIIYIVFQILGGLSAWVLYKQMIKKE